MNQYIQSKQEEFDKAIEFFKKDISNLRTGRANPGMLDGIQAEAYGVKTPLNGLASITISDAKTIQVSPWDKNVIKDIEKAILKSDLGLTPSNDGKIIRIAIPPLTEERRKELVKVVHKKCEDYKVSIRNIRRDANDLLKSMKKDGEISEDDAFKAQDQVQKITDEQIKLVDECYNEKEKEILEF